MTFCICIPTGMRVSKHQWIIIFSPLQISIYWQDQVNYKGRNSLRKMIDVSEMKTRTNLIVFTGFTRAFPSTGLRQRCPRVSFSHCLGPIVFRPISGHYPLSRQKEALSCSPSSRDRNEEGSVCSVSHDYKCISQPDHITLGVFLSQGE